LRLLSDGVPSRLRFVDTVSLRVAQAPHRAARMRLNEITSCVSGDVGSVVLGGINNE
jgi:hypothetical protein